MIYYRSWCQTVDVTLTSLNASLLVRHPQTKKFYVNYDPKIRELLHEAEYLMKMNLQIDGPALSLCMNEDLYKTTGDG